MSRPIPEGIGFNRDQIKSAVAAGDPTIVQQVIDNGAFKRKIHKVADVDTDAHKITFVVSADNASCPNP